MVSEMTFPAGSKIYGKELHSYYRDSFKVRVSKAGLDARDVYHSIFGFLPKSVQLALVCRNSMVRCFGFSVSNTKMSLPLEEIKVGKKAGFLTIESVEASEILCSASESNMDMWISVLKLSEQEFAVSTLVNLKTLSGRVYMAFIKPFHKLIAKYCIKQALSSGRM